MFCPNCGAQVDDQALFCGECGASLIEDQEDEQFFEDDCLEEDPSGSAKQGFFHSTAGKVVTAVAAICLAGTAAITGMAQYNANHPELLEVDEGSAEAEEGDEIYDVNALTEEQQAMIGPMGALIYNSRDVSSDEDGMHTWTAAEDSWGPLNDLFNDFAGLYDDGSERIRMDSDDSVLVSEDFVKECASALYADFDGILPEVPVMPAEGMGIRGKDGDAYAFGVEDRGEDRLDFSIYSWVGHADGSDTLLVESFDYLGNLQDTYQFDLVENPYINEQENPVFVYAVSAMTKLSEGSSEEGDEIWAEVETLDSSDEDDYLDEEEAWEEEWDDTWITDDADTSDVWDDSWYTEDNMKEKEEEKPSSSGSSNSGSKAYIASKEESESKEAKENNAESKEFKEEEKPADQQDMKEDTKEEENTQDPGNDTSASDTDFKNSWKLIQSYEMSQTGYDARDLADSKYFCTSLSFTIDGATLVDQGDYYEVKAVFNKPVLLPQNMGVGDTYTAVTDELKGETTVFTGGLDLDGDFSVFNDASGIGTTYGWYGNFNGEDGMTEVIGDDGYCLEEPFYEGVLRIRKDAVMGNLLDYDHSYQTVTASDLAEGNGWGGYWSNYTAFDADGYVTELIYNGC